MRAKQAEKRGKKQNSVRKDLARRKDNALLGHRSRALMRSLIKTREKQYVSTVFIVRVFTPFLSPIWGKSTKRKTLYIVFHFLETFNI